MKLIVSEGPSSELALKHLGPRYAERRTGHTYVAPLEPEHPREALVLTCPCCGQKLDEAKLADFWQSKHAEVVEALLRTMRTIATSSSDGQAIPQADTGERG
jgi:hypothetical protein